MSDQLEHQKKLTHKLIMEMTQVKYGNKFRKFLQYEGLGAGVCFVMALLLLLNFAKLDTWYFITLGILALVFLIGLPILVLRALIRIRSIDITGGNYRDTLMKYARSKKNLLFVQRLVIYLSYVFVVISLPLAGKLLNDVNYFQRDLSWLWFIPAMVFVLYFVTRWAYRHYVRATERAEELIRELQ